MGFYRDMGYPCKPSCGCQKSWVITGYGLSEGRVMTESTVLPFTHRCTGRPMDSYIIAKLLFVLTSIFEILVTFSILWIYQDVYFPLFGIFFTTTQMDGSVSFVNSSSGFDGMINNTTVTELMIVIVSLSRWDPYHMITPG